MGDHQIPASFGEWVRTRRKRLDFTQAELGKRAGCSAAAIRKFEADERKPSRPLAELLANALHISLPERQAFLQMARGLLPEHFSTSLPEAVPPNNLPAPLTSHIQRPRESAAIAALLADPEIRWVTLLGPPGIGKTRLGIQCGRQALAGYPDGVWFVDLAAVNSARLVLDEVTRMLGTLGLSPSARLEQIIAQLGNRRLLLLMDNFEHVAAAAADIAGLLRGCQGVKVLATSRMPLHISGEYEYPVPPLSTPPAGSWDDPVLVGDCEAVQLFVARARQHLHGFNVTSQNSVRIAEICATLEGMPLGLELAAASLHHLTLDELLARLHHLDGETWINLLQAQLRDVPPRQQSLENAIAWSFSLLSEDQRLLFSDLAVFTGWFDTQAVSAVCEMDVKTALNMLESLAEHSLLVRGNVGGSLCWRMLEIIHEYANLLLDAGRRAQLEARRARHFLARLQATAQTITTNQATALFEINLPNLRDTLRWIIEHEAADFSHQFIFTLADYWNILGHLREGMETIQLWLRAHPEAEALLRADMLQLAADFSWQQHDFENSLEFSRQSAELGRLARLRGKNPIYLNRLGRIYIEMEKYAEARATLEESLTLALEEPTILNPGSPLAQLGEVAWFEGDLPAATAYLHQALTYLPENNIIFRSIALTDLAEVALAQQDLAAAHTWMTQAFPLVSQHIRRMLIFLCTLTGYLVSSDAERKLIQAARFLGTIEAIGERAGVVFSGYYLHLIGDRAATIQRRLTRSQWESAFAEGKQWNRETALAEARQSLQAE